MAEQVAARPLPERPSKNLDELVEQLHRELGRLTGRGAASDTATGSVPKLRGYLRNVQALTWRRVASGDVESPRTVLEQLAEAQAFAAEHLREITDPLAAAAAEVESVLGSLELADEALEQTRVAVRLKDRDTSPREREVLRVLWENRDQYLVRSDIHKRMEESIRPT
ncbi:MAG: hypothetical protein GY856_09905, partial [bacterium]|nr:hypothetical protein [bacterium]